MKKLLVVGVIVLFLGVAIAPSINANINEAFLKIPKNPLLPPLMWTEDFSTFYLCIPNNHSGENVFYLIDWGDGDITGWLGPFMSNETVSISHIWDNGEYHIQVYTKNEYSESKHAEYLISLLPIEKLFCPILGYIDINYKFTIELKGFDSYIFYWGDGTYSDWVTRTANKSYSSPGDYHIAIKARDIHNNQTSIHILVTILPLEGAALGITKVNGGVFSFTIKNYGYEIAYNVSWSIHFDGGMVYPRKQESFNNYGSLVPGEEWTIVFWPSAIPEDKHFIFGIGSVTITMMADSDNIEGISKTVDGFVILLFVII